MLLCNECAAKVRLNFPKHELMESGKGSISERCGHCHKRRYCGEYELKQKEARTDEQ